MVAAAPRAGFGDAAAAPSPGIARTAKASTAVAAKLASASAHHAQAQPCGAPAAACSTAGTSKADSVMPKPVPP